MTRPLHHDEASEALAAAALDALEADEQSAVLLHAATCPICGPSSRRCATPSPVRRRPPRCRKGEIDSRLARARTRLLARVNADRARANRRFRPDCGEERALSLVVQARRQFSFTPRRARPGGQYCGNRRSHARAGGLGETGSGRTRLGRDACGHARAGLAERDSLVRRSCLTGPETSRRIARGKPRSGRLGASCSGIGANSWTMFARAGPWAPPPGKTYQVWPVTPTP